MNKNTKRMPFKKRCEAGSDNGKIIPHLFLPHTLNTGTNKITIDADSFSSAQYIYSLAVDAVKIDSKNMALTK